MARTILIAGKTGSGKTTAIRTLDPKSTLVLRVIRRTLPFKEAKEYSAENKNMFDTPTYDKAIAFLKRANELEHIKNVVITDGTYIMRQEFFNRATEKGYDKFTDFGLHLQQVIIQIQKMRDDMNIFFEFHVENVAASDTGVMEYKAATVGKFVDEKYNIFENVDFILYADPKFENNSVEYGFWTGPSIDRFGARRPSKSPLGCFDAPFIPNDLKYVADKIEEYYGG